LNFTHKRIYHVSFYDHFETSNATHTPLILHVTGRFLERRGRYLLFENWWSGEENGSADIRTFAFVVESAIAKAKEVK